MGRALTPGLVATDNTVVQKVRELPVAGAISVAVGDRVESSSIIGTASLEGDLSILRIPERLGIEPIDVVKGLREQGIAEGVEVRAGDLLCRHRGLFGFFSSEYRSPESGVVELISERTGHVGLRLSPRLVSIKAYVSGQIVRVDAGRSATIESSCALVQGIFGVGGEVVGKLHPLDIAPTSVLTIQHLPLNCEGLILAGGCAPSGDTLKEASRRGARGLVVGSVDDRALYSYLGYDIGIALTGDEEISMTVIVTEGFGEIPLSARAWKILSGRAGAVVSINGATQVRAGAVRPEIIIPHTEAIAQRPSAEFTHELQVGSSIRLIRVPYFGQCATVTALPPELVKIETGAVARVLRCKLSDGSEITVPRANVEIAG